MLKLQMKYQKNIIQIQLNKGFSLVELVITIAISSFLLTAVTGGVFFLFSGFKRAENNSVEIKQAAFFFNAIASDILNPDIYPHHPYKDQDNKEDENQNEEDNYKFNEKSISFFANGGRVSYIFDNSKFTIERKEKKEEYDLVKDFEIRYYDKDGYEISNVIDEYPYFCRLTFIMYDKNKVILDMRL